MILDQIDDIFYALSWDDDLTSWQLRILQMRQMLHRHSKDHWAALNVNFDVSTKRISNITVQRSQVQKQSDNSVTT